ncbi:MAG TPA: hypothetical protein VMT70_06970 [Vicinamibacteria bacterium]|nr:hypothetical protein [Vicinamibacteria bacterium]
MDGDPERARVEPLMDEVRARVRDELRQRLRERGASPDLRDAELLDRVASVFQRALDRRHRDALLLPEMLDEDEEWRLDEPLRLSSHRARLGRAVTLVKRRLLLPLARWLYDYCEERFGRQHRVNRTLFALLEEMAVENARLRSDVSALRRALDGEDAPARPSR